MRDARYRWDPGAAGGRLLPIAAVLIVVTVGLCANVASATDRPTSAPAGRILLDKPTLSRGATAPTSPSPIGWYNLTGASAPSPRQMPAIAYDPADGYTVLFGGGQFNGGVLDGDTWAYSHGSWTQLHPSVSPSARMGAGLVFDAHDGYLLMFGGLHWTPYTNFVSDTWAFAGGQWRELSPAQSPTARWQFGMTYDAADNGVLLFGGGDYTPLNDTWLFQGGQWSQLTEPIAPSARSDLSVAFDPALNESLLFGGSGASVSLGDTWAFSNERWQRLVTPFAPPNSTDYSFAYDPQVAAIVLATPLTLATGAPTLTYLFNATGWRNLTPTLGLNDFPLVSWAGIAWDAADHYLVAFGGMYPGGIYSNTTWALDSLNANATANARDGEVPFNVSFTANVTGGIAPLATWWNLSAGPSVVMPNGSFAVVDPGNRSLTFTVLDAVGESVTVGPFYFSAFAPVALAINATPVNGTAPLTVSFTGTASAGLPPYTYHWSFGDGTSGVGSPMTHLYSSPGTYLVRLAVTDGLGGTAARELNVTVEAANHGGPGNSSSAAGTPGNILLIAVLGGGGAAAGVVGFALWRYRRKPRA